MTMDAARPFYRLGSVRFIGPVPSLDFYEFLRTRFARSGFSVPVGTGDKALGMILSKAEEVPYNVQLLAHACWDQLRAGRSQKERSLVPALVNQSLERVIRQYDPLYTQLRNSLTASS